MSLTFIEDSDGTITNEVAKLEQLRDRMVVWATSKNPSSGQMYESYQEFDLILQQARARQEALEELVEEEPHG